ncbi:MAG TPA: hypothetical protein VEK77_09540 [Gemmatimonadales bacterium]|nr:hypothetical protein [Gemmatimonadales bacterium]
MIRHLTFATVLLASACKVTPPTPPDYVVSYHLTGAPQISCDSVKYKDAAGTVIKVTSPPLPWSVAYVAPAGTFVAGSAWMVATGSAQAANLKVTWTISGVSTASDSSFGTSTGAGKFTLTVAHQL